MFNGGNKVGSNACAGGNNNESDADDNTNGNNDGCANNDGLSQSKLVIDNNSTYSFDLFEGGNKVWEI